MGRLGAALEAATVKKGPECSVGRLLATMDPEDAADLAKYLLGQQDSDGVWSGVPASTISDELAKLGHETSYDTLRRHRKTLRGQPRGCACRV